MLAMSGRMFDQRPCSKPGQKFRETLPEGKAALVIGHPGHELRIHHWLEIAQPLTFVLTDGSGRGKKSRLSSTAEIVRRTGAKPGPIFGCWTDAEAYDIFRAGNLGALCEVTLALATAFEEHEIVAVVGDAMEGINPTHDLCRYLTNAAVLLVSRRTQRDLANYDFVVGGPPPSPRAHNGCISIDLDAEALDRKWRAAANYPALRTEVLLAKMLYGRQRFATEILRPVPPDFSPGFSGRPHYEIHGEKRVKEGHYTEAISYRQHVLPLIEALWRKLNLPISTSEPCIAS